MTLNQIGWNFNPLEIQETLANMGIGGNTGVMGNLRSDKIKLLLYFDIYH